MKKRKTWIKVKRGILQPKHRIQLGVRIWLYLHILDRADWETGKVLEWVDENEAEVLEMPVKTLRHQRRQLEEDGYITAKKGQYSQEIIIHKWSDPRKYDGEILNESTQKRPLSEEIQSPNSAESQPESQPESSSDFHKSEDSSLIPHTTYHKSYKEKDSSAEKTADNGRPPKRSPKQEINTRLIEYFSDVSGIPVPVPETKAEGRSFGTKWSAPVYHIMKSVDGNEDNAMALIKESYKRLSSNGMIIKGPISLIGTCDSIIGEVNKGTFKKSDYKEILREFMMEEKNG